MPKIDSTPYLDGYRMPGEFEPQDEIWIAWPELNSTWTWGAKPAQEAFVEVATAISQETPVTVIVSQSQYQNACMRLPDTIRIIEMSLNDAWMRDMGPTYVIDDKGQRRAVSWMFNAYGQTYNPYYDEQVAEKIARIHNDDFYQAPFVLEGGSIHCDGEGTLYTTEECLLHDNRNPQYSRKDIERGLSDYLNVEKVIWLPFGLFGDEDTNGHVDNLIHVVGPAQVALTWTDDTNHPQYQISNTALDILLNATDAKGRKIKVHKLPFPKTLVMTESDVLGIDQCEGWYREAGEPLSASYANFLITNNLVVFPTFNQPSDDVAKNVLREIFPTKKVVGVAGRQIVMGGGNVHCITQQIPSVSK